MRALTGQEMEMVAGGWFMGSEISSSARIGAIVVTSENYAQLAQRLHSLTYQWALRDIETFRQTGLHVTNPQGSLIPWQQAQVDWSQFGANNSNVSNEQVLQNFIEYTDSTINGDGG
jgi:hypothetical protein